MLEGKESMEEVHQLFNNLFTRIGTKILLTFHQQNYSRDHNKVQTGLGNAVPSSAGAF